MYMRASILTGTFTSYCTVHKPIYALAMHKAWCTALWYRLDEQLCVHVCVCFGAYACVYEAAYLSVDGRMKVLMSWMRPKLP